MKSHILLILSVLPLFNCASSKPSDTAAIDAGVPSPSSSHDASVADVAMPVAPLDGGYDATSPSAACVPTNDPVLTTWPQPAVRRGACTDEQIDQFYFDCIEGAFDTAAECDRFFLDSRTPGTCGACLYAKSVYAPKTVYAEVPIGDGKDSFMLMNVPGCMAALAATDADRHCADADAQRDICRANYCNKACADSSSYGACLKLASAGPCKTAEDATNTACPDWNVSGSVFERCWDSDPVKRYEKVAHVLCGSLSADGGADGSSDARAD